MNQIIIKFVFRGANVTWFVNDNWIAPISFLLTLLTAKVFKFIKSKMSSETIKMPNPKGGTFIDECIEPDSIYELVDRPLEIVLKQMLNLPQEAGPIVISVPLFILAYVVSRQPIRQITILGVNIFADKIRNTAIKAGLGIAGGSIFLSIGLVGLATTLLTGVIIFNIAKGTNFIECDDLVSKVTMERVSGEKIIGFLETLPKKTPKVFIQGSEDTELYIPSPNDNDSCSSEYEQPLNLKTKQIDRTCKKKYVPLKVRTKTLADLKKEDSTENREKAAPSINRYEDKAKNFEDKRKSIMNKRVP
jgi:hypothetical protein